MLLHILADWPAQATDMIVKVVGSEGHDARAPERDYPALLRSLAVTRNVEFLGAITRADWDVLVAVRNLFYEASEGGVLDEMAVAHPPKRVLGGISVGERRP